MVNYRKEYHTYVLMESPSVYGSQNYKESCIATKKEERRLVELKKKQQYLSSGRSTSSDKKLQRRSFSTQKSGSDWSKHRSSVKQQPLRCYLCDSPNHLVWARKLVFRRRKKIR